MDETRWRDPVWLSDVHAWIAGRLDELGFVRAGEIEQGHVYPWSTVLRVPVAGGQVWFKANTEALRYEAALVARIAQRRPDIVPPPLAIDDATGWMLMTDAGESLRSVTARERSLDRWYDVLPRYASVQLDLAGEVDDLLALGVPDRRLVGLPDGYERLLDAIGAERRFWDARPMVAALCDELAAYGLPELIQHDDLHDGQVFVQNGHHLVLDWGDACVSHPFFTLSVTLEGGLAWGLDDVENSVNIGPFRDTYLRPFAERYDSDPVAAATVAMRLGWVSRAVNGHVTSDREKTLARLRMFLDRRP
jgi:hypothetical protein